MSLRSGSGQNGLWMEQASRGGQSPYPGVVRFPTPTLFFYRFIIKETEAVKIAQLPELGIFSSSLLTAILHPMGCEQTKQIIWNVNK